MDGENVLSNNLEKWLKCSYYDSVCLTKGGGLLVGASSLTHRYWTGKLIYFKNYNFDAPNINIITSEVFADSSITNVHYLNLTDRVLTAHDSGNISLWMLNEDVNTISPLISDVEHDDSVTSLDVSLSQVRFITGSKDCSVKIWNSDECLSLSTHMGHIDEVTSLSFSPVNEDVFLSASLDKRIFLWDIRNSKPVTIIGALSEELPMCLTWLPDNVHHYMVGTKTGDILLMDTRSPGNQIKAFHVHDRSVTKISFQSFRPSLLASASHDTSISLSQYNAKKEELKIEYTDSSHRDVVQDFTWDLQNARVISCSWDGTLKAHTIDKNKMEVL